jgi:acetylornithine deacetylase/succinyl-diaminopimelate desuccinylase-like protein
MPPAARAVAAEAVTPRQEVARLAALAAVQAAVRWFTANEEELRRLQLDVVRIPAPPHGEARRAEWLAERFRDASLTGVHIDEVGNVIGILHGSDPNRGAVAITAHIDTVFPAHSKLEVRRDGSKLFGPGIADNGAGVVALLALASALRAANLQLTGDIIFVGNVGEEGEGDLRGIRHLFTASPLKDRIAHTLVLDGAATDVIVTQALGSRRFEIVVRGPGGHSWSDFGVPNPIVALARVVGHLSQLPLSERPKTTMNVGVIQGGTSVNSIPERASARVDIRSASVTELDRMERALREAVSAALEEESRGARNSKPRTRLTHEIKLIGSRPAADLEPGARILQVMKAVDAHLGNTSRVHRASTDANIPLSLGREAVSIGAGGSAGDAHTLHEWYDASGRDLGLKRALLALLALAGVEE